MVSLFGTAAMKVIGKPILAKFEQRHADVRPQVNSWLAEVEDALWSSPADIKTRFPSASFLSNSRVVFNLKGNHYRLLVQVNYPAKVVLVIKIGTHADYDRWKL